MAQGGNVVLTLELGGASKELGRWTPKDLQMWRQSSQKERTPESAQSSRWTGVLLGDLVDRGLKALGPEARAEIDLVILKNDSGMRALVPRSVIVKYPVLVALEKDQKRISETQLPQVIVPWTSKRKMQEESLPLERYFVPGLTRIELTSYKEKYAELYLKRRTDPSAMRGEKLFVQNCVGCHGAGHGPAVSEFRNEAKVRSLASTGHPRVQGNPRLTERDQRAILNYLEAYRQENAIGVSSAAANVAAPAPKTVTR